MSGIPATPPPPPPTNNSNKPVINNVLHFTGFRIIEKYAIYDPVFVTIVITVTRISPGTGNSTTYCVPVQLACPTTMTPEQVQAFWS